MMSLGISSRMHYLRIDLLVCLSDDNQVRELLLTGLFAHMDQGELF